MVVSGDPDAPGLNPSLTKKISEEKVIDVAEVNQWHWLENVKQSHLALASSKPVLQKDI